LELINLICDNFELRKNPKNVRKNIGFALQSASFFANGYPQKTVPFSGRAHVRGVRIVCGIAVSSSLQNVHMRKPMTSKKFEKRSHLGPVSAHMGASKKGG